jgi:transposase
MAGHGCRWKQTSGDGKQTNQASRMRVKTLLNKTQRFPGFCFGDPWLEGSRVMVRMQERKGSLGVCPHCQKHRPGYDRQAERKWLFLPILGFMLTLLYAPRRVQCPEHGVVVEELPWSDGKSPVSIPMMLFLARWARRLSWQEVASVFAVGWRNVRDSVAWVVAYGLKHRKLDGVSALGVDEIHWGRGKGAANFLTVVYQLDAGTRRLLCVEKGRSARSYHRALNQLGPKVVSAVRYICTDMWPAFLKVNRERLPQALNILDRFHICSHLNGAVDQVRRGEVARLGKSRRAKKLKQMRWHLLKRGKRVRGKARAKLQALLDSKLATAKAWMFKESFQHFWTYNAPNRAIAFLSTWCQAARRTRLQPLARVARMLEYHQDLIANWFIAKKQFSNAITEGFNGKIRVVTKRAYGYRTFEIMQLALYHGLGGLPEPKPPHRFC